MMGVDVATTASSEALCQTVETIYEILVSVNGVLVKKDSFKEVASYLERILPVLSELEKKNLEHFDNFSNVVEIIHREVNAAKQLMLHCSQRNKVYLLMKCRTIVKALQDTSREISRALGLLPLATMDISSAIVEDIEKLSDTMWKCEYRAAVVEEEIMEKIESGIQERNVDRSYANNLVALIAEAVGISIEKSTLKKELEEFKSEIENVRQRKDHAEAIQMDQIIALLERADAASSPKEKEMKYFTKRKSLGSQPLEPLQSFYCPITGDVMVDPVETSSGQTFERNAIEKLLADGNTLCPLTRMPLDTSVLRPNKTLQQSIEEWKDRNTMIMIASMKQKLNSEEDKEILHVLGELQDLCEHRDLHREWVMLENYIPILIQLLSAKSRDIRRQVLVILCILAKDSDDSKERILKVENAIESIVQSLGRRAEERKIAVALLLEISKSNSARECIGMVQGCMLLLATISNSDDSQASGDAQKLLEKLSFSYQNVIQMAKANYYKYLLHCLSTGPEHVKMIMTATLAELELTDHNKESLLEGGVLGPLLDFVSHGDIKMKKVAVIALQNLSSFPKIGLQLIREGAECPLLDLLFHHSSSNSSLREHVATTIMHLAASTLSQESHQTPVSFLESDDYIFRLFSLINLTVPEVQNCIIRTFYILCQSSSATIIKTKLIESSTVFTLVQLCQHDDNLHVRANAVKLLGCLAEGGDEAFTMEHLGQVFIETIIRIVKSSNDEEEIASAMGIISNLPVNVQSTKWLLDLGAITIILSFLQKRNPYGSHKTQMIENAIAAICHFNSPTNLDWQKSAAEAGIMPILVQFLETGTTVTKQRAAISLAQFSKSSPLLSRPMPKHKGIWCFSAPRETGCQVHGGFCSVNSSFCLIEADAIEPLVKNLGESDLETCEASLDALLTLIEGERLQSGCKVLADANAIRPIIRFLSCSSPSLLEKSLHALERIFRLSEFKQSFGAFAQMLLVDLTQRGNGNVKSMAARILAHLNVLHDQSSYF